MIINKQKKEKMMNKQEIADKMTNIENILTGDGQEEYLKLLDEFIGLYDKLRGLDNDNTRDISKGERK